MCPFWYNFDTVLCQFLETGTSDKCLIGIVQNLKFSGFILYPLSFFLYSPFEKKKNSHGVGNPGLLEHIMVSLSLKEVIGNILMGFCVCGCAHLGLQC